VPSHWQLNIDLEPLKAIQIRLPGRQQSETFWYLRYKVTNRTGSDRIFVPKLALYTDTGQVLRAGQKTPSAVFKRIKSLYNDPLLNDLAEMAGKLLQGRDNAKRGVAIWPDFDAKAGEVDIFIGGLSGEAVEISLPKPITVTRLDAQGKEQVVQKTKIILTKTLRLHYATLGQASARPYAAPQLKKQDWVMR